MKQFSLRRVRLTEAILDSLHEQAAMLAALITADPKLVLGVSSRHPLSIWDVAKLMVSQNNGNSFAHECGDGS